MDLRQSLEGKLTKKEIRHLRTSYDIIGSIAIMEIPPELKKKEKVIGNAILQLRKEVKTVCKKAGIHRGKYRTQKLTVIAGEKTKEATYRENGCTIQLDVGKVYFSPRLSTERQRVAGLVRKGESVLVMFSGVAPYPLVISKLAKPKEIFGIELNPVAHKYALENIALNKIKNITLIKGDVRKVKLNKKFDRVVMPLPKGGEDFLNVALKYAKKKGIIHFYDFLHETEFDLAEEKVKKACSEAKRGCKILNFVKCGQYGPGIFRVCVDFEAL
ncbi:class I SAM-dependent methyltransferase family protein [Candidatus Woesearchaeota archaeon]|nr:class I SAM-dependent methyltransferase family protein [Candidatus Woesearchaeota archaeon]